MAGRQRILPVRREYNRWVANQTLEDYALRFTAKSARRWSTPRVAQTAIGAISFLALEAIGGAITLSYGIDQRHRRDHRRRHRAVPHRPADRALCLALRRRHRPAHPRRRLRLYRLDHHLADLRHLHLHPVRHRSLDHVDGAASSRFGIPLWLGYIISAVAVIPLVTHGITWISRFQLITQPLWIVLNILPVGFIAWQDWGIGRDLARLPGPRAGDRRSPASTSSQFGAAGSVILALMPQIGEQVDILRFLPADGLERQARPHRARCSPAPAGSSSARRSCCSARSSPCWRCATACRPSTPPSRRRCMSSPSAMCCPGTDAALLLTAAFVVVSQLKINVMNAYAGSLAWSNFFSRLTHSHPGRVVWLVFNVAIALLLMELGIYRALETDARPLLDRRRRLARHDRRRPRHQQAARPVAARHRVQARPSLRHQPGRRRRDGASPRRSALIAAVGLFGAIAEALAPFIALVVALHRRAGDRLGDQGQLLPRPQAAGALAAAQRDPAARSASITSSPRTCAYCPAYSGPICSLCCSLDARCHDLCKPHARLQAQVSEAVVAPCCRRSDRGADQPAHRAVSRHPRRCSWR